MFPFSRVLAEIEIAASEASNHPLPAAWRHLACGVTGEANNEPGRARSSCNREANAYAEAASQVLRHAASDPDWEQLSSAEFAAFQRELTRAKNSADELRNLRRKVARSFHPDTSRYGAAAAARLGELNALIDTAIAQLPRKSGSDST